MITDETAQELADAITAFLQTRRNSKEEAYLKIKPKKNKQGLITNGAINERLLTIIKSHPFDKDKVAEIEKAKKLKNQLPLNFHQERFKKLLAFVNGEVSDAEVIDLKSEYRNFCDQNTQEHEPITWLTNWTKKAKDISFATHVGKLTHSSSKSSSILDLTMIQDTRYLTTNSLSETAIDTAASNAASIPIAEVLKLTSSNDSSVLDCIKSGDQSIFQKLTDDDSLVNTWCEHLKQAYDRSDKQSYFLSKQTYFPTEPCQYHLLLPLTSSSLVQAMHLEHKKYFDDVNRVAREQKKRGKYSEEIISFYPKKAYIHVTGSNHSNASTLNGQRGGRIALLPTMPPSWQSKFVSYENKTTIFDKGLALILKEEIIGLQKYLLLLKNKTLSISEPKRNAAVLNKLKLIIERFFDHIQLIMTHALDTNWTKASKLPIEQQLLFEPLRNDTQAKAVRVSKQWQKTLSESIGRWLNKQLGKNNTLNLKPIHSALWAEVFLIELREYTAIQEVSL